MKIELYDFIEKLHAVNCEVSYIDNKIYIKKYVKKAGLQIITINLNKHNIVYSQSYGNVIGGGNVFVSQCIDKAHEIKDLFSQIGIPDVFEHTTPQEFQELLLNL